MQQQSTRKHFAERLAQLAHEMEVAPPDPTGSTALEDAAAVAQYCATLLSTHDPNQQLRTIAHHCQRDASSEESAIPFVGDPCVYYTHPLHTPPLTS